MGNATVALRAFLISCKEHGEDCLSRLLRDLQHIAVDGLATPLLDGIGDEVLSLKMAG